MVTPAVILTLLAAAPGDSHLLTVDLGLSGAYAQEAGQESCAALEGDCGSAYARGPGVSVSAQLLLGGWVRGGVRSDVLYVPGSDTSVDATWTAVGRLGRRVFFDLGVGLGYVWMKRPLIGSSGTRSGGNLGFAVTLGFGGYFTERLAFLGQVGMVTGIPGMLFVTAGIEYRTFRW